MKINTICWALFKLPRVLLNFFKYSKFHSFKIIRKIAKVILFRMRGSYLMLGLTYSCNANCKFCSIAMYPKNKNKELTTEEAKNVIDQAFKLDIVNVNFFGGEPILRPDIMELISYTSKKGISTCLDTNGHLLTKKKVKKLKKAGLDILYVTINSSIPEVHDKICNLKGNFENATEGIKFAVGAGLRCIVSTCATRENVNNDELKKIIKFSKTLGASGVRILMPMKSGKFLHKIDKMLTLKEKRKIKELLNYPFIFTEGFLFDFEGCCISHKRYFYISPYGEVQPCFAIPLSFGSVREEPLKIILRRMWRHGLFKHRDWFKECLTRNEEFVEKYINTIPSGTELPFRVK